MRNNEQLQFLEEIYQRIDHPMNNVERAARSSSYRIELKDFLSSELPEDLFDKIDPKVSTIIIDTKTLEKIPNSIFSKLTNLRTIEIRNSQINVISNKLFSYLPKLERLCLSGNKIAFIEPYVFKNNQILRNVNLNNNLLVEIPKNVFNNIKSIQSISITNNKLKVLHREIFLNLPLLSTIDISNNRICKIELDFFKNCPSLNTLNLSKNNLTVLTGKQFSQLDYLSHLDISSNQVQSLPDDFFTGLLYIYVLNLSKNKIKYLSAKTFHDLKGKITTGIQIFNQNRNKPDEMLIINDLNLSHNEIETIPENLLPECNLKKIDFSHNQIRQIPFDLFQKISSNETKSLSHINFSHNQIESLPLNIFRSHDRLSEIDFSYNKISKLTDYLITNCRFIRRIDFSHNKIQEISNNSISNCTNLRRLSLNNNEISTIAESAFTNCFNIEFIELSNNRLINLLPNTFKDQINLRTLKLNNNDITSLDPMIFSNSIKLSVLDLSYNKLTNLSSLKVHMLSNLNHFLLEGNPLKNMPSPKIEFKKRDLTELNEFLKDITEFCRDNKKDQNSYGLRRIVSILVRLGNKLDGLPQIVIANVLTDTGKHKYSDILSLSEYFRKQNQHGKEQILQYFEQNPLAIRNLTQIFLLLQNEKQFDLLESILYKILLFSEKRITEIHSKENFDGEDRAHYRQLLFTDVSEILVAFGENYASKLLKILLSGAFEFSQFISNIIAKMNNRLIVHDVIEILQKTDQPYFYQLLNILVVMNAKESINTIIKFINGNYPPKEKSLSYRIRDAILALGELNATNAGDLFIKILNDKTQEEYIRSSAAYACGCIKENAALGSLWSAYKEPEKDRDGIDRLVISANFGYNDQSLQTKSLEALVKMGEWEALKMFYRSIRGIKGGSRDRSICIFLNKIIQSEEIGNLNYARFKVIISESDDKELEEDFWYLLTYIISWGASFVKNDWINLFALKLANDLWNEERENGYIDKFTFIFLTEHANKTIKNQSRALAKKMITSGQLR